ncbi:hypothetical protein ABW19_dt0208190 [Dactylella cylindrospora]|nr:hypothetical protein ABW19_dt0208190 [Dactylella cylindrospora]
MDTEACESACLVSIPASLLNLGSVSVELKLQIHSEHGQAALEATQPVDQSSLIDRPRKSFEALMQEAKEVITKLNEEAQSCNNELIDHTVRIRKMQEKKDAMGGLVSAVGKAYKLSDKAASLEADTQKPKGVMKKSKEKTSNPLKPVYPDGRNVFGYIVPPES